MQQDDNVSHISEEIQKKNEIEVDAYENYNDNDNNNEKLIKNINDLKKSKDMENLNSQNKLIENQDSDIPYESEPDMEYEKNENNNEEGKSKKIIKKKNKKKKKKKKTNPSNPPRKNQNEKMTVKNEKNENKKSNLNDLTSYRSNDEGNQKNNNDIIGMEVKNNKEINTGRYFMNKKNRKETNKNTDSNQPKIDKDILYDKMDYAEYKDDRGFCKMFSSMIKNNNKLFFIFGCDSNDFYSRASVTILPLNFYIFINYLLMYNSSTHHLYMDRDFDLKEQLEGKALIVNIIVPFLVYILTCIIKKMTSIKEFINDRNNEVEMITDDLKWGKKILKAHDIKTKVSKFLNNMNDWGGELFFFGLIFLILNFYVITCFCGIYNNSFDCLLVNTCMSMIFTFIITLVLFAVSVGIRCYWGNKDDKNKMTSVAFGLSSCLNPFYVMYNLFDPNRNKKKEKEKNSDEKEIPHQENSQNKEKQN